MSSWEWKKILKTKADHKKKVSKTRKIHVWYFWEGPKSITVKFCIMNWETVLAQSKYNFQVHEINNGNVGDWIDTKRIPCTRQNDRTLSALKSDFIRLALLEKYGGLYMDASVVMTTTPDWLLKEVEKGWTFQAFYNPNNMLYGPAYPVIENNLLFASKPKHPIVVTWLKSMLNLECTVAGRSKWLDKHIKGEKVRMQANLDYEYHFPYHGLQRVWEKIKAFKDFKGVKLYNTFDYKYGVGESLPQKLLLEDDFKPSKKKEYPQHFYKLISDHRKVVDDLLSRNKVNRNSFLGILLLQNGGVHQTMRYIRPPRKSTVLLRCRKSPGLPTDNPLKSYLDCLPIKTRTKPRRKKRKKRT